MSDIRDFFKNFVTVYLHDGCIYSRTLKEHTENMFLVRQRHKEDGTKLRLKKWFVGLQEIKYLDYTVSLGKLSVSTPKVNNIKDVPIPTTRREVCSFDQL
jgi:hypothetical protein